MNHTVLSRYNLYQVIFGWMNFVLVLPSIYLLLGLPLIMREYGWSGADIGLFQLAGLPAVFKLLLAIPVQRFRFGNKNYSHWIFIFVLSLVFLFYLISEPFLLTRRMPLFYLALLINLFATWADIPLNALAIKLLPRSEQMRAGSIRSVACFLGTIFGSGFMLIIQGLWGWQAPFYIMSASLLIGLLLIKLLNENNHNNKYIAQISKTSISSIDFSGYFTQPGAKIWTFFLMTSVSFVGAIWLYLKPMLLDFGFEAQLIAWIVGVGGGIIGAISSLFSRKLFQHLGIEKSIPFCLFFVLSATVILTLCVTLDLSPKWIIISIFLVAVSMGAISSLIFGLMMFYTRNRYKAFDYGLQASLFVITRLTFPIGAGLLLDSGGYSLMLTGTSLGIFVTFIFTFLTKTHIHSMSIYISKVSQGKIN